MGKRFKTGDLFAIPLPDGKFVTGRVMFVGQKQLPVKKAREEALKLREKIEENVDGVLITKPEGSIGTFLSTLTNGPINLSNHCVLVDIYSEIYDEPTPSISKTLIKGISTFSVAFHNGLWPIIGYKGVEPHEVEFPEYIYSVPPGVGDWFYQRGEVTLHLLGEKGKDEWNGLKIHQSIMGSNFITDSVLYYLGYETNPNYSLERKDLRFNSGRKKVYEVLGINGDEEYFEFSKLHGYDLSRLYY